MSAANPQQIKHAIDMGRNALKSGDLAGGCRHLDGIEHPEALYLFALAKHQLGHGDIAERSLRRALSLQPQFEQAGVALGRLLIETERLSEGEAAFDALIGGGNNEPEILFMRARARLELGKINEGLKDLQDVHARQPSVDSLKTLASTLWMIGEHDAFDNLLGQTTRNPEFAVAAADMLRESGQPERAVAAIDDARKSLTLPIDAFAVVTQAHLDLDDPESAERTARDSLNVDPNDHDIKSRLISALLMQGEAASALELIEPMRGMEPEAQHWIAYEATALRLLGDERYDALVNLDDFVRTYTLPTPDGFESLDEFNKTLYTSS